jgi:hypothetical protein
VRRYTEYLKYVLRHKWFVFRECLKLGVPLWIAILHDWDKFLPDEFIPYARYFHNPDGSKRQIRSATGYYKPTDTGNAAFDWAWFLHAKRNKHHWQWWVLPTEGENKVLPIPDVFRREMLADWRGAGKAQGTPDSLIWYQTNKDKLQLHADTRAWIEKQIGYEAVDLPIAS